MSRRIVLMENPGLVLPQFGSQTFTFFPYSFTEFSKNVKVVMLINILKKRPKLWKDKSWVLHQDYAPAHSALSVKRFLAKYSIPVLDHPPYSPDLAPCDFYLFPKVKSALKGTRFESIEAVKKRAARVLKELTEEDFQHCFEQWKIRMERCRDRGGVYIKGDNK